MPSSSSLLLSRKVSMNSFVNLNRLVFLECFLYLFSYFYFLSITVMCSSVSISSSNNLLRQSLFTTFIKLENFSAISLDYGVDRQSLITRNIWTNFLPGHWYKITCLMCHTSLCHNIEVHEFHEFNILILSFHDIQVLKSN